MPPRFQFEETLKFWWKRRIN